MPTVNKVVFLDALTAHHVVEGTLHHFHKWLLVEGLLKSLLGKGFSPLSEFFSLYLVNVDLLRALLHGCILLLKTVGEERFKFLDEHESKNIAEGSRYIYEFFFAKEFFLCLVCKLSVGFNASNV